MATLDKLSLGPMPIDLGFAQFITNQGKEYKPLAHCSYNEVHHFKIDCTIRVQGAG